ncbi:MAG TPA: type II secretion system protein [Patescibacteria group bacterium]|jgi:type IV pilus assembly protein PilA|nr:type II secretion system protein [Patescibacteria group bacterium]
MKKNLQQGFTLIELLVVIGIIAVLAAIVLIAINPSRQFKQANNAQRSSNLNAILNAFGQQLADNKGTSCVTGVPTAPTAAVDIKNGGADFSCLTPTYISQLPFDPSGGSWTSATNYDTKYFAQYDAAGRLTITAPSTELGVTVLSVTR